MKILDDITIGADIECFAMRDSLFVTAEGVIKGTKDEPFFFDDPKEYFTTQLDNVLAEFTIPPVRDASGFLNNIVKSKNYVKESLEAEGLSTVFLPSARFGNDQLTTRTAKQFGCNPDFNAWQDGATNCMATASASNLRTAGFHVHVGYNENDNYTSIELMKFFDTFVTLPALLIEPDNERREIYGKAGAFRYKPYGLEARTLSSYFAENEKLINWVFAQTNEAIDNMNKFHTIDPDLGEQVVAAINGNDKDLASSICKQLNINHVIAA